MTLQRDMPQRGQAPRASSTPSKPKEPLEIVPEAWMKYPAMWGFLVEDAAPVRKRNARKAPPTPDDLQPPPHAPRMDGERAAAEIVRRRAAFAGEDPGESWRQYFVWNFRGGRWTGETKGIAIVCVMASMIENTEAGHFFDCYPLLKRSASFSIMLYGESAALGLARGWLMRHCYFMEKWMMASGSPRHRFTQEDIEGFEESLEFRALASGATGALEKRVRPLRSMRPQ